MSLSHTVRRSLSSSLALGRERFRRSPRRLLVTWLLQAVVLMIVGSLLPGVLVEDLISALIAAAVIAGFNALVRPIIVVLTLPLTVATFGLLSLLINSSMIVLAAPLEPGLEVNGFLPAFSLAVILTVVTTIVNVVLAVDEDETFYAELARRINTDDELDEGPRPAGLVVIQIDGLAAPTLRNAIRVGTVPRMASWVRAGDYRLTVWECPPPSQTSASQAGILHGNNDDIPAFRWFEKATGRLLVSNKPADAAEIERRVSDGRGLLHPAGTSVGNLFTGDAAHSAFVMSRIHGTVGTLDVDAFSLHFVDPAAFIRTLVLTTGEFLKEIVESRRQRVDDIQPRVHPGQHLRLPARGHQRRAARSQHHLRGAFDVNSSFDADLEEVAAFEELVGSHGGMGGPQTRPFLMHPVELAQADGPIVGAPAVNRQLRRWAEQIGVAGEAVLRPRTGADLPEPRGLRWVAGWMILLGVIPLVLLSLAGVALLEMGPQEASALMDGSDVVVAVVLVGIGVVPAFVAVAIFFYLTRPHVAAAFRTSHSRKGAEGTQAGP